MTTSSSNSIDRHSLGQIAKIGLGLFILAIIGFVYIPKLFFTYSVNAVVSSKIIRVGAPIDGVLTKNPPPVGTELKAGDVITRIENPTLDKSALGEIQTEYNAVKENVKALTDEKNTLEALRQKLMTGQKEYKENKEKRLRIDLKRAELRHLEMIDSVKQNQIRLDRQEHLVRHGVVTRSRVDTALLSKGRAEKAAEQIKMEMERIRSELESIKKGISIGTDGKGDALYEQTREDELRIRQSDLESKIRREKARMDILSIRLDNEKVRVSKLAASDVKAPSYSVIWRSQVAQNGYVGSKSPVVDLIDCSRVFVEMTVDGAYFEKINVGDPVKVKVIGADHPIDGKVMAIRGGSLAREIAHSTAGTTPLKMDREIQVFVSIDPKDLGTQKGEFCHVGRNAKVVFSNKKAGLLQVVKSLI